MLRFGIDFGPILHDFGIICASFSLLFRHRFWYRLLYRFWTDFGSKMAPKIGPWAAIFDKKATPKHGPSIRGASWSRPCVPRPLKTYKIQFFQFWKDFGSIFKEFWQILDQFLMDLNKFLVNFWCNPSAKRPHERRDDETAKQRSDERGNDKTTPPFGKTFLRPGGMRASALNNNN